MNVIRRKPVVVWVSTGHALHKRTYHYQECGLITDRDENSAINILMRFLARLGPHALLGGRGVLQEDQNSVEVMEASCLTQVQQLQLW